jgi:hypothetical protein
VPASISISPSGVRDARRRLVSAKTILLIRFVPHDVRIGQNPAVYGSADLSRQFDAGLKGVAVGVAPGKQTLLIFLGNESMPLDIAEHQLCHVSVIEALSVVLLIRMESVAQDLESLYVDPEGYWVRILDYTESN